MKKIFKSLFTVYLILLLFFISGCKNKEIDKTKPVTLQEYLEKGKEEWFSTGKKEYIVQAMMVSKPLSFHNDYENADYLVEDDGETIVIKGTVGEMWASKLSKVIDTYTRPDGTKIESADFTIKDTYIDLLSIPSADSNYAMFVPKDVSVIVETAWGDTLYANSEGTDHGEGDYLVCRVGEDGKPDLSDVWVLNGVIFKNTYQN